MTEHTPPLDDDSDDWDRQMEADIERLGSAEFMRRLSTGPLLDRIQTFEAERDTLRQQLAAAREHGHMLHHLLETAVHNYVVPGEDGPGCHFCNATWEYDGDTPLINTATIWHHDDCPVILTRALAAAQELSGVQRLDLGNQREGERG